MLIILESVVLMGAWQALYNVRLPELTPEPSGLLVERAHHRMGL